MVKFQPRGHWFDSLLEQCLLKTKPVNSGLGNRNMARKIPTWWKNPVCGNKKMAGKNSSKMGNFTHWEKNRLPLHGAVSTAAPVV